LKASIQQEQAKSVALKKEFEEVEATMKLLEKYINKQLQFPLHSI
jgi:hypothetical protein